MSREALYRLWDHKAFKSAPSLWEAARTHVPFAELGVEPAPEGLMLSGLRQDGLTLLIGPSGSGKSNVLAHTADQLSSEEVAGRRVLPIFVPVAGREDVSRDPQRFGSAAIQEVLLAFRGGLDKEYREKLEKLMADDVGLQRTGPKLNAKLIGRIFGSGGDVGLEFAQEVLTLNGVVDRADGGLRELGDICRAKKRELVLLLDDTDGWARSPSGLELARAFFTSVAHVLRRDVDIPIAIAMQRTWIDDELPEVLATVEDAVATARMPEIEDVELATTLLLAVLQRRVEDEYGDDRERPNTDGLFTESALRHLASGIVETQSVRQALAEIRDALDRHSDDLPNQIDITHLLAAAGD